MRGRVFLASILLSAIVGLVLPSGVANANPNWPSYCWGSTNYPHYSSYFGGQVKAVGYTQCSTIKYITVQTNLLDSGNYFVGGDADGASTTYVDANATMNGCYDGTFRGMSTHRVILSGNYAYRYSDTGQIWVSCP